jgi:hypothetical protein
MDVAAAGYGLAFGSGIAIRCISFERIGNRRCAGPFSCIEY